MPLPRLTITGYARRFSTASRPFEGAAEDSSGREYHLCVKPLLRGVANCGVQLAAEVVGVILARRIGLSVPDGFLVEVGSDFIAATGGALSDVKPGIAFGSAWMEQSFPWSKRPAGSTDAVNNPETVAGVTVLDTLVQNDDRHHENVLLAPILTGANPQWRLGYIDNAYSWRVGAGVALQEPKDAALRELVTDQEQFGAYLFEAEAFDGAALESLVLKLQAIGWALDANHHSITADRVREAAKVVRALVFADVLKHFPNCDRRNS